MLKMIIVDDEFIILESLKKLINWHSIGIEVLGTADNGAAAIDLAFKLQPDIILSDISMPSFSGLEMLETLRKKQIQVEVIFISAYSKFEYAREAIKYGAFDYILKPIKEDQLLDTVSRCAKKIRGYSEQPRTSSNSAEDWGEHLKNGHSVYYDGIANEAPRVYAGFAEVKAAVLGQIKSADTDGISGALLDFFRLIAREGSIFDPDTVRLHCFELVDHILRELEDYQIQDYLNSSRKTFNIKKNIASCTTLDSAFDVTRNLLVNFSNCVKEIQSNSTKRLINAAVDYIHENYHKDITLSQAAQHLYITPTYLSKIFSAEMHEPFSRYLLSHRVKIAKELLRDTRYKVYEVAARVGYTDIVHFSKLFKQITGQTPNQYRNRT